MRLLTLFLAWVLLHTGIRTSHAEVSADDLRQAAQRLAVVELVEKNVEVRSRPAGRNETWWNGGGNSGVRSSGLFLVRIEALGSSLTKRIVHVQ